jgi:hypothetical protein
MTIPSLSTLLFTANPKQTRFLSTNAVYGSPNSASQTIDQIENSSDNFASSQTKSSDNFFWKTIKWLRKNLNIVQLSTIIFFLGNLVGIPISHIARIRRKASPVDLFTGLRNDISSLIMGLTTYTVPVLASNGWASNYVKKKALEDSSKGSLNNESQETQNQLIEYGAALFSLIAGFLMNDVLKQFLGPSLEGLSGRLLIKQQKILKISGFKDYQGLKKELELNGILNGKNK